MATKFKKIILSLFLIFSFSFIIWASTNVYQSLRLFERVFRYVKLYYVEDVDSDKLIKEAIKGMLSSLDPHSAYLDEKALKELEIKTKGKYGGLGIIITKIGDWVTVVAPIEGTPAYRAGIRSGDKIIKINGESAKGISLDEAVSKMRGEPGTKITITIKRGDLEPFDVTLIREMIKLKAVPYYGKVGKDIGYIRLSQFIRGAGKEVKNAILELKKEGAKKFILDLRGNPGGLLDEAVKVADNFIDSGKIIVFTKGRNSYREYRANSPSLIDDEPLVILVDRGSASASEIVAGAVQDWEKGILIGDTTFGKGSVQNIYRISWTEAIKLTTARYYTPCGRCIDKTDTTKYLLRNPTAGKEFESFGKYKIKRKGGGAIIPDIVMKMPKVPQIVDKIARKGLFIDFAGYYTSKHEELKEEREIEITEEIFDDFRAFLKRKDFEYSEKDFNEAKPFIKRTLEMELSECISGIKGKYKAMLKDDEMVKKAKEILDRVKTLDDLITYVYTQRR